MPRPFLKNLALGPLAAAAVLVGGCVLAPEETKHEQEALRTAGDSFERPFDLRTLPEVPAEPTWPVLVDRAMRANGEVEAAYHEWAAAVHRVEQAGGYPNTPLSTSFSYGLRGGGSAFDRTSVTVGPDPMENLAFPPKVYQAAKIALDDAKAARHRFAAKAFEVRRGVLGGWIAYALQAERVRIQGENVRLLKLLSETAASRVQAGGPQQDLIRAETAFRIGQNELANLEAMLPQQRAQLNAALARPPDAPLPPPALMPLPRAMTLDDASLLALAAERNPRLEMLVNQVRGRANAIELARLQYVPDFNPFLGVTGSVSQVIGLGISIPTLLPELRGKVREARADLGGMMATYRQTKFDTAAGVVAALVTLRNSERQAALYDQQIIPATDRLLSLAREGYAAGAGTFLDLIDAQRTSLDARIGLAEARAARESTLADLEALLGVDLEALTPPTTRPGTEPFAPDHAAMNHSRSNTAEPQD
ncbi:MAG TPA: TolC family protein [Tepidisphaeraceae bacterium]